MKKLSVLLSLMCIITIAKGATSITTSSVSGHWALSGSPYLIYNDITINSGQSLIVDPGVSIIFQGAYAVYVNGIFQAKGTSVAPISFDIQDTTGWSSGVLTGSHAGGWDGIGLSPYSSSGSDTSALTYCNIQHMKNGSVNLLRNLHVSHCNFYYNTGGVLGLFSSDSTGSIAPEVSDCNFYDNLAALGSLCQVNVSMPVWYVHGNSFYNNTVSAGGNIVSGQNAGLIFENNSIYQNATDYISDTVGNAFIVYFGGNSVVSFAKNRVYENTCGLHAIIFCNNGMIDFNGNYICNNQHRLAEICEEADGGGAFLLTGSGDYSSAVFSIRNNVIANNYSPLYGGGIYLYDAKALIANNQIVNNKAPRGCGIDLWIIDPTTVCIKNNIIYGNVNDGITLALSDEVHVSSFGPATIKYDHNWSTHPFYSGFASASYGTGSINVVGDTTTDVIGISPGLVAPTLTPNVTESALTADFSLLSTSPCINAGSDSAVVAGSADHGGNDRVSGGTVDIGAYEYGAPLLASWPMVRTDTIYTTCCHLVSFLALSSSLPGIVHNSMQVYPNPASNLVFISTPDARGNIVLMDVTGRQVTEKTVGGKLTSFDVSELPKGTYFAKWNNGDGMQETKKVVLE